MKVDNNQKVLSDTPGTFTDLQDDIAGYSVVLAKNYTYDSNGDDGNIPKTGILINTPKIIDGNGFTINAMNVSKIFNVTSSDVTFKNINFIYAHAADKIDNKDFSDCGAAIVAYSGINDNDHVLNNISIIGCTFEGCHADVGHAGAVYAYATNVLVSDCSFTGNSAPKRGGALYTRGANVTVKNSKFYDNYQQDSGNIEFGGAAIYFYSANNTIESSSFNNNTAYNGGALYVQNDNTTIVDCNFTNNSAKYYSNSGNPYKGGGGAIWVNNTHLNVKNSFFDNNTAYNGGAIYVVNDGANITGTKFTNNLARYSNNNMGGGGAIYFSAETHDDNKTHAYIDDCEFINNTAALNAGAIFISHNTISVLNSIFKNNTAHSQAGGIYVYYGKKSVIQYCEFTGNKALANLTSEKPESYGGAIRTYNAENTTIDNCNFTENRVNHNAGGAIESHGINIAISNCNFYNNSADSDGGAIYSHDKGLINITGCNFTNNYVSMINEKTPIKSGGAILINQRDQDGKLTATISKCNFINNTAPMIGGALVLRTNTNPKWGIFYSNVTDCTFIGNNATWGSALYLYVDARVNLTNIVFGKNRANSSSLNISVDKPVSYYPSDVTLTVNFTGKDNIANAIWNGGDHSSWVKNDQITDDYSSITEAEPSHVYLKNITYEIYHDGELKTVTVYPNEMKNPVLGYQQADVGNNIWQDVLEDAQNITIDIYKVEDNTQGSSRPGVLSAGNNNMFTAGNTETLVASVNAPLTEINGEMENIQQGLKPGNYIAKAKHATDAYYTEASNSVAFKILEGLNITKHTKDTEVYVGDIVTYTINITNDGESFLKYVVINDTLADSDAFELLSDEIITKWSDGWNDPIPYEGSTIQIEGSGNLIYDSNEKVFTFDITADSYTSIMPKASVEITLKFKAKKVGKYNNTVTITAEGYNPLNATSQDTTVRANSTVNGTNETEMYGQPVHVDFSSQNATNVTYKIIDKSGKVVKEGTIGPSGTIEVTGLAVGNYTVNMTNIVKEFYNRATNQSYIRITPAPSVVEGENVTVTYGEPIVVPYTSDNSTAVVY